MKANFLSDEVAKKLKIPPNRVTVLFDLVKWEILIWVMDKSGWFKKLEHNYVLVGVSAHPDLAISWTTK